MKTGSTVSSAAEPAINCSMCGASKADPWETRPWQRKTLGRQSRFADNAQSWAICDECQEGLEGLQIAAPPKPDRIMLLSHIRRATIDDQRAVLEWLLQKYKLEAQPQK